ncbi:hypothetical protein Ngar_c21450 [Candidatus Nitrososphaera gargensis Ga9.2]|uniref:Uncharacterized protein n=1 Tax=Nitrososphaera gargensis (strain Ga9.2) TaxID=1237085 RepID=K0IGV0_NITGG|nr:hypothetical protein Ngar_c21450 [Candidatus Nitrososphaera gargensis Ga9.2]
MALETDTLGHDYNSGAGAILSNSFSLIYWTTYLANVKRVCKVTRHFESSNKIAAGTPAFDCSGL